MTPKKRKENEAYRDFINKFQEENIFEPENIKEYNRKFKIENNEFVSKNFSNPKDVEFYSYKDI